MSDDRREFWRRFRRAAWEAAVWIVRVLGWLDDHFDLF
jgi:hypothetical protein